MRTVRRVSLLATATALPWFWFAPLGGPVAEAIGLVMPAVGLGAAIGAVAVAIVAPSRWFSMPLVSAALVAVVAVVSPWTPRSSPGEPVRPLVVAAANVFSPENGRPVAERLLARDADLLVVSELSPSVTEVLADAYPHEVKGRDVGLFSTVPLVPLRRIDGLAAYDVRPVRVEAADGWFILVAAHLPRPGLQRASDYQVSLIRHQRLVDALVEWVEEQRLPVVIAGDLNISDRGPSYEQLTGVLDDAMRSDWTGPTSLRWPQRLLLLRIDHILAPEDWCWSGSTRYRIPGSDHRGVEATVGRCAG